MKYFILALIPVFFLACGGGSNSNTTSIIQVPNPQGSWYQPDIHTSWQWQLNTTLNTSYDVDLFDIDLFDTDPEIIKELHRQGKKVICYFSAGSYENWREDKNVFPLEVLGNDMNGWAGEKWLNISSELIKPIMLNRLDLAREKGCDGVEPDNIDGYTNNTGFALSSSDQLDYNIFLAEEAHRRNLSIGLKNDINQVHELEIYFDFAVNEQCHQYNECSRLDIFIEHNKAVFNAEYAQAYVDNTDNKRDLMCANSILSKFQTLVLPIKLDDAFRISCQ